MDRYGPILIVVALAAVTVVLLAGLFNMMRGGPASTSQKLMRARVLLQFIAVIIVMTIFYFSTRGG